MTASVPWEIKDAAERLDGVSDAALVSALGAALDQVHSLRGVFAYAALELQRALAYKGFSTYRRPFGEAQVDLLIRAASGDAHGVISDRQPNRVELAPRREGIDLPSRFAVPVLTVIGEESDPGLRLAVAYAYREAFELRQLATYEAGVALAHHIPSGPKGVRTILVGIYSMLLAVARDPAASVIGSPDYPGALSKVGASPVLTRSSYEKERGIV